MADEWVRVATTSDVPDGPPWPEVTIGGDAIVLVTDGSGAIFAIRSHCAHLGAPLTRAEVVDDVIECNRHFYTYDLATGANAWPGDDSDLGVPVYEVEVRGDAVWVRTVASEPE